MPMLAPTCDVRRPRSERGSSSAASRRSATSRRTSRRGCRRSRMPNSSPPSRAARSEPRRTDRSRSATATRSSSPAPWPRLSLMVLKSSRSRNRAAIEPGLRALGKRRRVASTNRRRLVRPVRGSWKAWKLSCASSARRSATSRSSRPTRPTSRASTSSDSRAVPSGRRPARPPSASGPSVTRAGPVSMAAGQAEEPDRAEPGHGDRVRVGQAPHRGMQRRGAEQDVGDQVEACRGGPR